MEGCIGGVEGPSKKKKERERERTYGNRQQCGDCGRGHEWVEVEEGTCGINSNGKIQ